MFDKCVCTFWILIDNIGWKKIKWFDNTIFVHSKYKWFIVIIDVKMPTPLASLIEKEEV